MRVLPNAAGTISACQACDSNAIHQDDFSPLLGTKVEHDADGRQLQLQEKQLEALYPSERRVAGYHRADTHNDMIEPQIVEEKRVKSPTLLGR